MNEELILKISIVITIILIPFNYKNYTKSKKEYYFYLKNSNMKNEIQYKRRVLILAGTRFIIIIISTVVILILIFLKLRS